MTWTWWRVWTLGGGLVWVWVWEGEKGREGRVRVGDEDEGRNGHTGSLISKS